MSNDGTLPQEIITEVLYRVPVKSLCRFKSVSHSWKTLISDPHFAKTHLNRTNSQNPKKLARNIILSSRAENLYSVDFADDVIPTATKLDFPAVEQPAGLKSLRVWGSCNGLLLVSHTRNSNYFLLNPSTRECKKLPTRPLLHDPTDGCSPCIFGVGYDSCTDDYKVVMLKYSTMSAVTIIDVYSLKNDAWRRIQDHPYRLMSTRCRVLFNGCLHCICWRDDSFESVAIFAFDFSDEFFREVPLPAALGAHEIDFSYDLAVLGDSLCFPYFLELSKQVEVWIMEEYGVRESWNKIRIEMPEQSTVKCLCMLADDKFLLKSDRVRQEKLVVYDPKKETMRDLVVSGIPSKFTFGGTYVESLVSPHNGGGIGRQ